MTATTVAEAEPSVASAEDDLRCVSVRAASELLDVDTGQIRKLLKSEDLQLVMVGALQRVSLASLQAFVKRGGTR